MASVISSSFETVKFSSPKRARLSLKHHAVSSLSKSKFEVDGIEDKQESMIIEQKQDENISPNCNIFGNKFSPYINDNIIKRNCKVSTVGLPNCGNTCYLNSILQVLRHTPNFLKTLHSLVTLQNQLAKLSSVPNEVKPDDFFQKLHMLYGNMKKQEEFLHKDRGDNYISALLDHVESFITSLGEISSLFKEGEQHDAHEFLLTVMSHFDVVALKIKQIAETYNLSKDFVQSSLSLSKEKRKISKREKCQLLSAFIESDLHKKASSFALGFEGQMQHTVKCLECEKRSERFEPFTNLEVTVASDIISEETVDLCQCLVQRTVLSGDNKYYCQECFHSTEAELRSQITSLPQVLVLHCSWLTQFNFSSQIEKDSTKIDIPLFIKVSEYDDIFQTTTDETYCLYAIVLHVGTSTENGHYVSFIKDMPETSEITNYLLLKNDDVRNCYAKENVFNTETSYSKNNWLFFDDEEVLPVNLSDTSVFPYYEFMTITSSPSIIFYYKE